MLCSLKMLLEVNSLLYFVLYWAGKMHLKHCFVCVTAALKDKGNEAYAQEDYETAVKYYSDGLVELRDMQTLYTNRAQVNISIVYCFLCYLWNVLELKTQILEKCL